MTPDNDTPDDDEEQPGGLLGAIRVLVQTLAEAERDGKTTFRKSGRIPGDHFTTEFGFSGQIGGPRNRSESRLGRHSQSESATGSNEERNDSYRVDIREDDDELLVVADMPNVDRTDITAGIDEERGEFVVGVGDEAVERIELPWSVEDVHARFQHGILELRFIREDDQ